MPRKDIIKHSAVLFCLSLLLFLVACHTNDDLLYAKNIAYDEGYEDGYEEGYFDGYNAGYDEGYDIGEMSGEDSAREYYHEEGMRDAAAMLNDGFYDYKVGFCDGYAEGYQYAQSGKRYDDSLYYDYSPDVSYNDLSYVGYGAGYASGFAIGYRDYISGRPFDNSFEK